MAVRKTTDPFANVGKKEEEDPVVSKATVEVTPKINGFEVNSDKIVLTLKGGAGFDDPWIVIHASSVKDADDALSDEALPGLMERTQKAAAYFRSQAPEKPKGTPTTPSRPEASKDVPEWAQPVPEGYVYRSGMKNGNVWHAHMPANKDSGLPVKWLNDPNAKRGFQRR